MTNVNLIRFTLSNGTQVHVKKVANNKYDFELQLENGNRKTFVWNADSSNSFENSKGFKDELALEAIEKFKAGQL